MTSETVWIELNGVPTSLATGPLTSLLRALRAAGFTGTQGACEQGECGSCSVLLDGALVCACLVATPTCAGRAVTTIEAGVADDLATAFERHGAVQCGFCTPGMVIAAEAVLQTGGQPPTRAEVTEGLAGNLCRCTGYRGIVDAVLDVAALRSAGS